MKNRDPGRGRGKCRQTSIHDGQYKPDTDLPASPDENINGLRRLFWQFRRLGVDMPIDRRLLVILGDRP